jgi:hypothetical protein
MLTNPVMFPPGLAKLATNPLPRGSDTIAKTRLYRTMMEFASALPWPPLPRFGKLN